MKKLFIAMLLLSNLVFANSFYEKGITQGITVELSSDKTLSQGDNEVNIKLSQNGTIIKDAQVRAKFFMPEMPGMPYMEYIDFGELEEDTYSTMINFSMSGTWQYHIEFKLHGKKYRYKSSVNLGQSSHHSHHMGM